MDTKNLYSEFVFCITLDTLIPLSDMKYKISTIGFDKIIEAKQTIQMRNNLGSLKIEGNVSTNPQPKNGIGNGFTKLIIRYIFPSPLTVEEFAEKLYISPMWHLTPTMWNFLIKEINRIIDIYRSQANAYWWNHIGMWNFDEVIINGINSEDEKESLISNCWPKHMLFRKSPFDDIVSDPQSMFNKYLINNFEVPFYFTLYMNGRRSYAEHNFREAQINFSNSLEAFAVWILKSTCLTKGMTEDEFIKFLDTTNGPKERFSKAYQYLAEMHYFPELKKRNLMKKVNVVMEFRDNVMHGDNPSLDWAKVGDIFSALNVIISIQPNIEEFITKKNKQNKT